MPVTGETLAEVVEIVETLGFLPEECKFGMRLGNHFTANALLLATPKQTPPGERTHD